MTQAKSAGVGVGGNPSPDHQPVAHALTPAVSHFSWGHAKRHTTHDGAARPAPSRHTDHAGGERDGMLLLLAIAREECRRQGGFVESASPPPDAGNVPSV